MAGKVVSVTSYDATTGRATIDVFGQSLTDVLNTTGEVLDPGWVVWAEQRGDALHADWVITDIYSPVVRNPKGRMFSTATQSIGTTPTRFDFNAAGGVTSYDIGGMVDRANSRLTVPRTCKYRYGCNVPFAAAGAGSRIVDIKLNNTTFIARVATDSIAALNLAVSDERAFSSGDFIELFLTSTGGAMTFGSASNELGCRLWMSLNP